MNKAILVMDMPDDCFECNFCVEMAAHDRCVAAGKRIFTLEKPDWCPLKELPEKYEVDKNKCRDPFYEFEFEYGYNQCIDEILRGDRKCTD
jgi:hypothetical protein